MIIVKIQLTSKRIGDKTHEELFDFNDDQKLILENDKMFIMLPRESRKITKLYAPNDSKLSDYTGFKAIVKASYSSPDYLDNDLIKKII